MNSFVNFCHVPKEHQFSHWCSYLDSVLKRGHEKSHKYIYVNHQNTQDFFSYKNKDYTSSKYTLLNASKILSISEHYLNNAIAVDAHTLNMSGLRKLEKRVEKHFYSGISGLVRKIFSSIFSCLGFEKSTLKIRINAIYEQIAFKETTLAQQEEKKPNLLQPKPESVKPDTPLDENISETNDSQEVLLNTDPLEQSLQPACQPLDNPVFAEQDDQSTESKKIADENVPFVPPANDPIVNPLEEPIKVSPAKADPEPTKGVSPVAVVSDQPAKPPTAKTDTLSLASMKEPEKEKQKKEKFEGINQAMSPYEISVKKESYNKMVNLEQVLAVSKDAPKPCFDHYLVILRDRARKHFSNLDSTFFNKVSLDDVPLSVKAEVEKIIKEFVENDFKERVRILEKNVKGMLKKIGILRQ